MVHITTLLFDSPGPQNTEAVLEAALARAREIGITQFVVASSTGRTALRAVQVLGEQGKVIGIHFAQAHWERWAAPDEEICARARELGVQFLVCTHAFGGLNFALEGRGDVPLTRVVAYTYYTFGQGMKVVVEDALMAADAGLLNMDEEVISIAGTERGADTAVVLQPAYSSRIFDLRVREVLAKPR